MIIYWSWPIPARFAGCNYGPISFIRPEKRDDVGLAAHENTHQAQFWASPLLFPFRYCFSRQAKLAYEVEAYKAQAACYEDDRLPLFAGFISANYNLPITPEAALALLKE